MKKMLVISLFLLVLFLPSLASAQLDQRCFTCSACVTARKNLGGVGNGSCTTEPLPDGFVQTTETIEACGKEVKKDDGTMEPMGFCLPAGSTKTQVTFGGRDTFANLADFIDYGYRYAIILAGVLATVMIIVSGFQWMASGGSSETISTAQDRIKHAVVGLGLSILSYAILDQVNPYLTALRLPRVWLVNQQGLTPTYCNSLQDGVKLALYKDQVEPGLSDADKAEKIKSVGFTLTKSQAQCDKEYFMEGAGALFCKGTLCPASPGGQKQVCLPKMEDQTQTECRQGNIGGLIYNTDVLSGITGSSVVGSTLFENWAWPTWVEDLELFRVCEDGDVNGDFSQIADGRFIGQLNSEKLQQYVIPVTPSSVDKAVTDCREHGGLKGFVIYAVMNESNTANNEPHFLGKNGPIAIDLGDKNGYIRNNGAFNTTKYVAPKKYFIQPEDITNGLILHIDAAEVTDIDEGDDQRQSVYRNVGF